MMVTGATSTFAGGFLPRLLGHRRKPILIGAATLVLAGSLVLLAGVRFQAPGWVLLAGYLLLAAATGSGPASLSTMKELNRADAVAQSIAVVNCVTYVGVACMAWAGGAVLDQFAAVAVRTAGGVVYPAAAYANLFALAAGLALVSLAASFLVRETRGEPVGPAARRSPVNGRTSG
jgi:predicted MFS family arabinose efflux permease